MFPSKSTTESARIVPWPEAKAPPTQEEVEARLHHEGYESFKWYDVPGMAYPKHAHELDECIWILKGELILEIGPVGETADNHGQSHSLKAGDRIYLPAKTPHTARVPASRSVTYIVGQKQASGAK